MFNKMFRFTAIMYFWKRYRQLILSTLCLFGVFWLVGTIHSDYVELSQLEQSNDYLAQSFVIKWLIYLVAVAVYLMVNSRGKSGKRAEKKAETKTKEKAAPKSEKGASASQVDPFSEIRNKDKLRSAADMVIEKHKK
jgi:hypothetical protein